MTKSLNFLARVIWGTTLGSNIGLVKGHARSLDHRSCRDYLGVVFR